jgi:hypothetical protein
MDLSVLNDWVVQVNSSVSLLCILLLLVVFFADKHFNSSSIGLLVLCLGEGISSIATPHLRDIASTPAPLNFFAWYGGWMIMYIICLALLLKFHRIFRLRVSDVSLTIAGYYAILTIIQAVDFIDRATFDSGIFAKFYQLSTLLMIIFVVPVVGFMFWREHSKRLSQLKLQEG